MQDRAPRCVIHSIVPAGLHRQCLFGGLRIGLYEPVKRFYMGSTPDAVAPFHTKVHTNKTNIGIVFLPSKSSSFHAYTAEVALAQQEGNDQESDCVLQVFAGLTTGALGILIASPTDLVKVRMQSESSGGVKRYPNARAAYGMIARWVQ